MTIGTPDSPRMARHTSIPLMPGSIRSSSTMSGRASRNAFSARSPSATKDGRNPSLRRTMPSISASAGSSSTTKIRALMRPNTCTSRPVSAARPPALAQYGQIHPGSHTWQSHARMACGWANRLGDGVQTGVLPLRPLTLGELLDAAVALLRGQAKVLLAAGFLLAVIEQAALYGLRVGTARPPYLLPYDDRLDIYWLALAVGFAT